MKLRFRPLFAWLGVFIAAGGVFLFSKNTTVLSLRNLKDRGSVCFRVASSEQVTLSYINSIYNAPVEEVLEVTQGNFVLRAVRTPSPAVMEYYGFEDSGPVKTLDRSLGPTFSIQISVRQDQAFRIGGRTLDLRSLGHPGDHVRIRVEEVSLASFLLRRFFASATQRCP